MIHSPSLYKDVFQNAITCPSRLEHYSVVAIFIVVWMLVVRGVPFPIIERLQVSVPLNSRPVAYYRKGGTTPRLRLF